MIKKILIDKDGKKYYYSNGDLHTHLGIIKEKNILKSKSEVKTNKKEKLKVIDANFLDNIGKIKRGAQTTNIKDIGSILIYSGINKDSIVLEAGSGSGQLTIFLSRFVKKVYSYEKNKSNHEIVKKNLDFFNIKNVELFNKDIKSSKEKNLDLIVLDMLDPWNYLKICKNLKKSCYLICYLTNINQVINLLKELNEFIVEKIISVNEQNWVSKGLVLRPEHFSLTHTAFLVFARKI